MRIATIVLMVLFGAAGFAQESQKRKAVEPADFPFMVRGYCLAGSVVEDDRAPGGFYASPNFPKKLDAADFAADEVFLRALPGKAGVFAEQYEGMSVQLINGTGKRQAFEASDSRIAIVQEARDADGTWRAIEYLPSSWCGNSYHRVFLGPREYWEFTAPRYSGSIESKLRFALRLDDGETIYSNEFDGSINPEQFTVQQGHTPTDIMDPYVN